MLCEKKNKRVPSVNELKWKQNNAEKRKSPPSGSHVRIPLSVAYQEEKKWQDRVLFKNMEEVMIQERISREAAPCDCTVWEAAKEQEPLNISNINTHPYYGKKHKGNLNYLTGIEDVIQMEEWCLPSIHWALSLWVPSAALNGCDTWNTSMEDSHRMVGSLYRSSQAI